MAQLGPLTRSATGLRVSFPLYLACGQDRVKAHAQGGVGRSPFWEAIGLAAVVFKASNEKNLKPACLGAFRETFLLDGISRSRDHGGPSLLLPSFLSVEANRDPAKRRDQEYEQQETGSAGQTL